LAHLVTVTFDRLHQTIHREEVRHPPSGWIYHPTQWLQLSASPTCQIQSSS
jgi:hypothetical protein